MDFINKSEIFFYQNDIKWRQTIFISPAPKSGTQKLKAPKKNSPVKMTSLKPCIFYS